MYLIIDNAGNVIAVSQRLIYAKTQANGTTIVTDRQSATAVYVSENDTFYRLQAGSPCDSVYRVAEVSALPTDIPIERLKYADGNVIIKNTDVEYARQQEMEIGKQPEQLRADLDYIMLMEGL